MVNLKDLLSDLTILADKDSVQILKGRSTIVYHERYPLLSKEAWAREVAIYKMLAMAPKLLDALLTIVSYDGESERESFQSELVNLLEKTTDLPIDQIVVQYKEYLTQALKEK